jgi:hypothetical protein
MMAVARSQAYFSSPGCAGVAPLQANGCRQAGRLSAADGADSQLPGHHPAPRSAACINGTAAEGAGMRAGGWTRASHAPLGGPSHLKLGRDRRRRGPRNPSVAMLGSCRLHTACLSPRAPLSVLRSSTSAAAGLVVALPAGCLFHQDGGRRLLVLLLLLLLAALSSGAKAAVREGSPTWLMPWLRASLQTNPERDGHSNVQPATVQLRAALAACCQPGGHHIPPPPPGGSRTPAQVHRAHLLLTKTLAAQAHDVGGFHTMPASATNCAQGCGGWG